MIDKADLVRKMEEYVQAYKDQLEKNDGSSLAALSDNAVTAFEGIKSKVMDNTRARAGLETFSEYIQKFEKACKEGDKQLSAKALILMEQAVQELKKKNTDAEDVNMP